MRLCESLMEREITLVGVNEPESVEEIGRLGRDRWYAYERAMAADIRTLVAESTVVLADNVTEYYYGSNETYRAADMPESLPNVAPPWPLTFIESQVCSDPTMRKELGFRSWGVLFEGIENDQEEREHAGRWQLRSNIILDVGGRLMLEAIGVAFSVDDSGRLVEAGTGPRVELMVPEGLERTADLYMSGAHFNDHLTYFIPALLTLCFIHCNNVTLRGETPERTRQQRRELARRGLPLLRYHIIDIRPVETLLGSEGDLEEQGLGKALHICRGHFKDFTDKGLFGKHHGTYWWHDQARGTPERGIVTKDYLVTPPDCEN